MVYFKWSSMTCNQSSSHLTSSSINSCPSEAWVGGMQTLRWCELLLLCSVELRRSIHIVSILKATKHYTPVLLQLQSKLIIRGTTSVRETKNQCWNINKDRFCLQTHTKKRETRKQHYASTVVAKLRPGGTDTIHQFHIAPTWPL